MAFGSSGALVGCEPQKSGTEKGGMGEFKWPVRLKGNIVDGL